MYCNIQTEITYDVKRFTQIVYMALRLLNESLKTLRVMDKDH